MGNSEHILTLVSAPAETPISLAEAKSYLKYDHTDEDTDVTASIEAATSHLDYANGILSRAIITQTWKLSLASPAIDGTVSLPVTPYASLSSIEYYDDDNVLQTLNTADFHVIEYEWVAMLVPNDGVEWPSVFDRRDAIQITYVAGYGAAAATPAAIKQAIKYLTGHFMENRDMVAGGMEFHELPFAFQTLLAPYRKIPMAC